MKKVYLLLIAIILSISFTSAQCVIDTTVLTFPGIYPPQDSLPCIVKDSSYDETLQIKVLQSFDTTFFGQSLTITVHWVHILKINGLPGGINWSLNPTSDTIKGGETACFNLAGLTDTSTGAYALHPIADLYVHIPAIFPFYAGGDTIFRNADLSRLGSPYKLYVVSTSDSCHLLQTAGINTLSNALNAMMDVYPNPNNGFFEVKLTTGQKINGELVITDMLGRKTYAETVNFNEAYHSTINLQKSGRGIYTILLNTPEGFAARKILIE